MRSAAAEEVESFMVWAPGWIRCRASDRARRWLQREELFRFADGQRDFADAIDVAGDPVAELQRTYAFGRARVDDVAGFKVIEMGQVSDDFPDVPDE